MNGDERALRLGHQLRRLRQRKELRPARVAEAVACDRSYISHLEAGRRWPSLRVAERLDRVAEQGRQPSSGTAELTLARVLPLTAKQLARIDALRDRPDQAADRGLVVLAALPLGRLRETNRRRAIALSRLVAEGPTTQLGQQFEERIRELPPTPALPSVQPRATP